MSQSFSSIGNVINLSTTLADFSVEQRRSIFNALLLDTECNPGQKEMSHEDRRSAVAWFQAWGGWNRGAPHPKR